LSNPPHPLKRLMPRSNCFFFIPLRRFRFPMISSSLVTSVSFFSGNPVVSAFYCEHKRSSRMILTFSFRTPSPPCQPESVSFFFWLLFVRLERPFLLPLYYETNPSVVISPFSLLEFISFFLLWLSGKHGFFFWFPAEGPLSLPQ